MTTATPIALPSMPLTLAQEGGLLSEDAQSLPAASEGGGAPTPTNTGPFGPNFLLIGMFALFAVIIFTQISAGRKEKKARAEMMNALGKHDKVQTVGGIIGSIIEIKGDELTLRVDETTNTRIKVARSAVQKVLKSSGRATSENAAETADA